MYRSANEADQPPLLKLNLKGNLPWIEDTLYTLLTIAHTDTGAPKQIVTYM